MAPRDFAQTFLTIGQAESKEQIVEAAQRITTAGTDRRTLRRQQAARRTEVLNAQAGVQLDAQPRVLRNLSDFKRAERLAIRRKDRDLERFLSSRSKEAVRYWTKFFKRYTGRGRPRGTGHPKAKLRDLLRGIRLDAKAERRLRKAGLNDRDLKVLFVFLSTGSQKAAAKELGITKQAVNKRFRDRIEPAFRRINPQFSSRYLRDLSAESAALSHSK